MGSCGSWAWYSEKEGFQRFFCGSGNCFREKCRVMFWSRRVRLITALIQEYSLIRFFTLTLAPKYLNDTSLNAWGYIHIPWSKLRKRLNRRFSNFKFVAILERHKDRDVPHIHGFTNVWLDIKEWSRIWDECRGGRIVWIEQVKQGQEVSQYVNKQIEVARYVSKDTIMPAYELDKRYRTLWRSRDTKAKFELTTSDKWSIIKEDVYNSKGEISNYHAKKGIWSDGKKKYKREDLETTCKPLS